MPGERQHQEPRVEGYPREGAVASHAGDVYDRENHVQAHGSDRDREMGLPGPELEFTPFGEQSDPCDHQARSEGYQQEERRTERGEPVVARGQGRDRLDRQQEHAVQGQEGGDEDRVEVGRAADPELEERVPLRQVHLFGRHGCDGAARRAGGAPWDGRFAMTDALFDGCPRDLSVPFEGCALRR